MLGGFLINKIMAIYLGPNGIALVGQFNNFYSLISTSANAGINQGTIKYIAEFRNDAGNQKRIISSSFYISLSASLFTMLLLVIFPAQFSFWVMQSKAYTNIFFLAGATIVLLSLNSFIISVLNGVGNIAKYVAINITSTLAGFILSYFLIKHFNLYGAFLATVLAQSAVLLVSVLFVLGDKNFTLQTLRYGIEKKTVAKLFRFSLMTIVSLIVAPVSQLTVRNYIGTHLSWTDAGYWQGVWTISDAYLAFITSVLAVYYLPSLSSKQNKSDLKVEVQKMFRIVVPLCATMAMLVFIFREQVIRLLFTSDFLMMKELFLFQLLGDVMKIASWIFGYVLIAKAMIKLTIFIEILLSTTFILLSIICLNTFGLIGVTYAFFINYLLYFIFISIFIRKYLSRE